MITDFSDDYSLERTRKVRARRFGFDLYVTPRFVHHFTANPYEELTALLIRQVCRRAACFIDVGAHYGFYSVLVGRENPDCSILAFEPVVENARILRRNLELNGVTGNVHEVAVSDRSGQSAFQVSHASDNSGFVANPKGGMLRTIDIRVAALDEYREEVPDGPVLVKIDVEGHEPRVLSGMEGLIRERDDLRLVVNFNPASLRANGSDPGDFLAAIDDRGFDVFVVHDEAMAFERCRNARSWRHIVRSKSHVNLMCIPRAHSLHVCFFSHSSGLEGAERSLLELVDTLVSERWTMCTVVLPSDGPLKRILNEKGAATLTGDYGWWSAGAAEIGGDIGLQMSNSCSEILGLVPVIEDAGPDVVVTNTLVLPWGGLTAAKLGLPHIWWINEFGELDHDLKFFLSFDKVLRIIDGSSNHIVAASNAVRETLFDGVSPDRCSMAYYDQISVPNAPDQSEEFFRSPSATKLVFVGRATAAKGVDDAINATKILVGDGHDVELCVVGNIDTPFGREMQRLVDELDLTERVRFLGFVENVREVVDQADIGLMCSKFEAFGRVTSETMLLGKPVIGTNTGGTVELIDDGFSGFLYSPGDVKGLAEKILFFVERPEAVREFGERARTVIVKKLKDRPVSKLMHVLSSKFKGSPGPGHTELLLALLEWQSMSIGELNRRVREMIEDARLREQQSAARDALLAENEVELRQTRTREDELKARLSNRDREVSRLAALSGELENQIGSIRAELGEREGQIERLVARSDELERLERDLRAGLSDRDVQIEKLSRRLKVFEEKAVELQEEISKRGERIDSMQREYDELIRSRAWNIANTLWRIRVVLAPPDSLRSRLLDWMGL